MLIEIVLTGDPLYLKNCLNLPSSLSPIFEIGMCLQTGPQMKTESVTIIHTL